MRLWAVMPMAMIALSGQTSAQDGAAQADPRAAEFCDTIAATVPVAECLPDAHVAVKVFDVFDTIYPPEAQPLRSRCDERNQNPNSSALCVIVAIETAMAEADGLPEGTPLDDPVLEAIRDPELFARLQAVQMEARTVFPDREFWGGGMYMPYDGGENPG